MKKFITAIALLLATTTVAMAGNGKHAGRQHTRRGAELRRQVAERLSLTGEQRQQMRAARLAARHRNRQLFTSVHNKRIEYRQLRAANDPAAAGVRAELRAMRPQLRAARERTRAEMRRILTPQQQASLDQLRAQRRSSNTSKGRSPSGRP